RLVRDEVEIELRIRIEIVAGGWQDANVDRLNRCNGLDASGCTQHVPRHRLGGGDGWDRLRVAPDGLECDRLVQIVRLRGGAVGVDVADCFLVYAGRTQRPVDAAHRACTTGGRGGDVVGIRRGCITDDFRIDLRATL